MSLLLYGITDGASTDPGPATGVGSRPVRRVDCHGLVALVSEHEGTPPSDEDTLWTFERVIEDHMTGGPVLPARFGSLVPDGEALREILSQRHAELGAQLERIRGAVELSVRVFWPESESESESEPRTAQTGTGYLLARAVPERRAGQLADRLHEQLDGLARSTRYRLLPRPTTPVTAAFLVGHEHVHEFAQRVEDLGAGLEDAELVCTGPWPAYSFVENQS